MQQDLRSRLNSRSERDLDLTFDLWSNKHSWAPLDALPDVHVGSQRVEDPGESAAAPHFLRLAQRLLASSGRDRLHGH